ncbi:hypothetical protein DVH24_027540 [Malus domestica]|uniref:DUF4005 domain-containing protein n=1 Tax=Malus domestica TaxID=3750 RepID=A0A498HEB2_MALDO|nr:hypothetical protein DVH24_027540 [Malus domestica]
MNNSTKLRYLSNNPWMNTLDEQSLFDPVKQAEQGWCDNPGTVTEVRAKLQMRQRGNIKRERAIAYSSQQRPRSSATLNSRGNMTPKDVRHKKVDENNSGWSWLEKWMAAKPWESRLMEVIQSVPSEVTPPYSHRTDGNVKVRRNNVTTRVSARPRTTNPITRSFSAPSSDSVQDDTSGSNSSTVWKLPKGRKCRGSLGKQRTSNCSNIQRHPIEEYHYHNKLMGFFNDDTRSNDNSDLYSPVVTCKAERVRYQ